MKPITTLLGAALLGACSSMQNDSSSVVQRPFGIDSRGQPATLWTLRSKGLEIDVSDHGATLVAVRAPDLAGQLADVILGFDDVAGYESADNQYFGCTAGRVCNRIAKGRFTLDGYEYQLAVNNGPNHLHGGSVRSLDKVHWQTEVLSQGNEPAIRFRYLSKDGEEGYPGNLDITATYRLDAVGLHIEFAAKTDARTPVNITNHAYWNLTGAGAPTVLDHELWIAADYYTPTDDTLIPTGAIAPATGALDFGKPTTIGLRIADVDGTPAAGYDHNFVLRKDGGMRHVATLKNRANGRAVEIVTDQPGLQLYSGNYLHGQVGKGGKSYARRSAVCLETQHYPDAVHHGHFPNTILEPGGSYRTETTFRFANR